MDMKESIRDLVKRSKVARENAETEEATKNSVIMPFIRALGFDVFDIGQVVPEFTADVGVKKGEKVDYALKNKDNICMLVEAKHVGTDLRETQFNQLYRYFNVTEAQIAILSNGVQFWFFSDIDEKNKMDKRPFFIFDLDSFDDEDVRELAKFHRDKFDISQILETAATLKYTSAAATYLSEQIRSPDDDFIRLVGKQIYDGNLTKSVIEQLRHPIRSAFGQVIRDRIQERLDVAFSAGDDSSPAQPVNAAEAEAASEVETTAEEWEAFHIVRAIASEIIQSDRITIRDTKSYCGILVDDNNRKPLCRLRFNSKSVKYIGIFDAEKREIRHQIDAPSDIFRFRDLIQDCARAHA